MEITEYGEDDLQAMIAVWNEVVDAGQAFPNEERLDSESGAEFFASQSYCGAARDEKGRLLGLYILHPNNIGRCGHICNCSYATAKASRGQGVGRALVEHSLAKAKELGFGIMQFNAVTSDNDAANALYPKLGFTRLGTIPGGFRRPDGSCQAINLYYKIL